MTDFEIAVLDKLDELAGINTAAVEELGRLEGYFIFFCVCLLFWAGYKLISKWL